MISSVIHGDAKSIREKNKFQLSSFFSVVRVMLSTEPHVATCGLNAAASGKNVFTVFT